MAVKTSKGYKGMAMEGFIATWYARNTRNSMKDFRKEAKKAAEGLSDGAAVLEVAPGPGYLAIELAKLGNFHITGLDISAKFVEIAQAEAKQAEVDVDFRQGNVSQMPFDDAVFDFIICRAAFKNFAEPIQALDEMHRVLKPGGRASVIDLRGDVAPETINQHVDTELHLTGFNAFVTKMVFKHSLIKRAYTKEQFRQMVSQSKFASCEIELDSIGLEVRLRK